MGESMTAMIWKAAWQQRSLALMSTGNLARFGDGPITQARGALPTHTLSPDFVHSPEWAASSMIHVTRRRAYGLRDEEHLRIRILTCMLSPL